MTKNKNGNNKDGLGIMDLMYLARYYPVRYWITIMAIQIGYVRLAKKYWILSRRETPCQ